MAWQAMTIQGCAPRAVLRCGRLHYRSLAVPRAVITHGHVTMLARAWANTTAATAACRSCVGAWATCRCRRMPRAPRSAWAGCRYHRIQPATCWVLAGAHRRRAAGLGGLRRLQAPARPDLRAVRSGALRYVHHRGNLRPADLPLAGHAGSRRGDRGVAPRMRTARRGGDPAVLCTGQGTTGAGRVVATGRPPRVAARRHRQWRSGTGRPAYRCWRRSPWPNRAVNPMPPAVDPRPALGCGHALDAPLRAPPAGLASGWMQLRGNRRRRNVDRASSFPITPIGQHC